jgi:Rod binding domain-containing protein
MRSSLRDIKNAIKGMIVMSSDLDSMYTAFLNNQVCKALATQRSLSLQISVSISAVAVAVAAAAVT